MEYPGARLSRVRGARFGVKCPGCPMQGVPARRLFLCGGQGAPARQLFLCGGLGAPARQLFL